jgi:hypothetical protein
MLRPSFTLASMACTSLLLLSACGTESDDPQTTVADDSGGLTQSGDGNPETSEGEATSSDSGADDDDDTGMEKLDVMMATATAEGTGDGDCEAPEHVPCDTDETDLITALGLNCPGEPVVNAFVNGSPDGAGTRVAFGTTDAFNPTEGMRYAVLGSGQVNELDDTTGIGCSSDLDLDFSNTYDPQTMLPAPIVPVDVGAVTCADDPSLIGTGDCSNTIQEQFEQATSGAHDYTEIRFGTTVPVGVTSFSYDFAFMSYEYPNFYASQFNDMYIGWLESEQWTGNISFDENGNPISLNAGFMDFLDADASGHPDCDIGTGCTAPELDGTCMDGHGSSRWLTTEASVVPGENITVVFAIFDMGDSILDSYVFLDNFLWGCEGGNPPSTVPID